MNSVTMMTKYTRDESKLRIHVADSNKCRTFMGAISKLPQQTQISQGGEFFTVEETSVTPLVAAALQPNRPQ